MEFQGLIDCILVLKSTLLSVAENGDKLGVETFSIAIVTAALTDGSEMSLIIPLIQLCKSIAGQFTFCYQDILGLGSHYCDQCDPPKPSVVEWV